MAENHHSDPNQPDSRASASAAGLPMRWRTVLLLFAVVSLYFWRLTLSSQYTWVDSGDVSSQVLPWFQFQVGELQQGRLPLWDPYPYGGQPLIGQTQPGAAYPFNWILFFMPTRHGWIRQNVLHWYYVLIHFMAAVFAYKLCRDQRLSDPASVLGALIFGLGGYMGYLDWPQMLNGAVWSPLVLMFLLRVERGERTLSSAALGGLCLGVSLLSGHHQIPTFVGLASAGLWGWLFASQPVRRRELAFAAPAFFAVAALTGGLQVVPAWEYSRLAVRWIGTATPVGHADKVPYHIHNQYSFMPANILGIAIPGFDPAMSFYVGTAAVTLGALGVLLRWRMVTVRVVFALLISSLVFAMGGNTIFHGILYALAPLVEKARSPHMATLVSNTALALLAAHGVDAWLAERESVWLRRFRWGLVIAAAIVFTGLWGLFVVQNGWYHDTRSSMAAEVAIALAALLAAWQRRAIGERAIPVLLGLFILFELGAATKVAYLRHREQGWERVPLLAGDKPWVEALRKLGPNARVQIASEDRPHNLGDWNGIDVWHSYLASLTTNVHRSKLHEGRTRELFGVAYFAGEKGKPTPEWHEPVAVSPAGFGIYRNPNALPRAFAVHEIVPVKSREEGRRLLENHGFDLRRKAFLEGSRAPGGVDRCAGTGDDVQIIRRVSNHVRLWADLECGGMVVLSDTFYPGWSATVDGKPAPIHEAYSVIRGVVVPKGKHWIEMRYRPGSFYLGAALSASGLMLALVLHFQSQQRRRLA